jgi:DNA-directed RNA polymerase specialized sigma24 family protein
MTDVQLDYTILRRWLWSKVPGITEDAVQEGLIAAWKAQTRHPGQALSYYLTAAQNGARSALTGNLLTGREAAHTRRDGGLTPDQPVEDDLLHILAGTGSSVEDELGLNDDSERRWLLERRVDEAILKLSATDQRYILTRFFDQGDARNSIQRGRRGEAQWARIRETLARELGDVLP